jgi:nitroreductase
MEFLELVRKRYSCRQYDARPVEREKIEQCLEAARLAPSASNSQPWTFVIVDELGLKDRLAGETFGRLLSFNHFSLQAPVLVALVAESPGVITRIGQFLKNRPFYLIDLGIAAEHFCLQAAELGLGTCMLGWFSARGVSRLLGIPSGKRTELVITLGYPAGDDTPEKKRKAIDQIRAFNKYPGAEGSGE